MIMGYIPSAPPKIEFIGKVKVYTPKQPKTAQRIEAFKSVNDPMDGITAMVMSSLFKDSINSTTNFGGGNFGGGGAGGEF